MMKKTLVLYTSTYGSTHKYAQWIAEAADADLMDASKTNPDILAGYDTIVFGGSLHAVGITGVKIITDNYEALREKKLIVFGVGCSPGRDRDLQRVWEANFTGEMRDRISFFYARGAFNFEKLHFVDKMMMRLLRMKLKRKKNLDQDSKNLLACYDHPVDFTNRKNIEPVIACIREG